MVRGLSRELILYLWGLALAASDKTLTLESMPMSWSAFLLALPLMLSPVFLSLSFLISPHSSTFLSREGLKAFPISCLRAVVTELALELILFILALIPRALSSLFFSTLQVFILPYSFQLSGSPLPSLFFWFFPSGLCILFKCTCPKLNRNSWYRSSCDRTNSWVLLMKRN